MNNSSEVGNHKIDNSEPILTTVRESIWLEENDQPKLSLQVQRQNVSQLTVGDIIYVHGATFGADLSIFYRFNKRSWADAMNDIGLTVWGFDFAGYGQSDRYLQNENQPAGRMVDVVQQLRRVVEAVQARNSNRPVSLVAHSWGASVAALYAGLYPQNLKSLVLFSPIVMRTTVSLKVQPISHYPLTLLAQYRRFVEDVPRNQPQVMSEVDFNAWAADYLATDHSARERTPPSVMTPYGPVADILTLWSGIELYDSTQIVAPTLIIHGEWDSYCTDTDVNYLLSKLGSKDKTDVKIECATHLMHLETQRTTLYAKVNEFLKRTMK